MLRYERGPDVGSSGFSVDSGHVCKKCWIIRGSISRQVSLQVLPSTETCHETAELLFLPPWLKLLPLTCGLLIVSATSGSVCRLCTKTCSLSVTLWKLHQWCWWSERRHQARASPGSFYTASSAGYPTGNLYSRMKPSCATLCLWCMRLPCKCIRCEPGSLYWLWAAGSVAHTACVSDLQFTDTSVTGVSTRR